MIKPIIITINGHSFGEWKADLDKQGKVKLISDDFGQFYSRANTFQAKLREILENGQSDDSSQVQTVEVLEQSESLENDNSEPEIIEDDQQEIIEDDEQEAAPEQSDLDAWLNA